MSLFQRSDGDPVRRLSPVRRIMPHLMRGRNESAVYYQQTFDLTRTCAFIRNWNQTHSKPLSVFDIIAAGCGRALHMRPGLNRFIAGGRIYQRRSVEIAFAVKQAFEDDAPMVTVKMPLGPAESLEETQERIHQLLTEARSGTERGIDTEVRWLDALPAVVLRAAVRLAEWASALNLLPSALIRNDPMFSSVFLANLGSIGLDGAFHHLYEYGTTSLFGVVGTVKKMQSLAEDGSTHVHDGVTVRWTFDERIHDGFYCAATLELLRSYVEDPAQLATGAGSSLANGNGRPRELHVSSQ